MMNADEICRLNDSLESERAVTKARWDSVVDYFMPGHGGVYGESAQEELDTKILDRTGADALRDYAAGMFANTINPSKPWFTLRIKSPELRQSKKANDEIAKRGKELHRLIQNSNIEAVLPQAFLHHGAFGAGCVYQDVVDGEFRFTAYSPANINVMENEHGIIDKVFRVFQFSNDQAYSRWKDQCSEDVKSAINSGDPVQKHAKRKYIHCVVPREKYDSKKLDSKNKKFASYYVDASSKKIVEESGYDAFPYYIFRFMKVDEAPWGISPAMIHVDTQRMLCQIDADMAGFAEKGIAPPAFFDDEETVSNGNISMDAGAVNYYRSVSGKPPYFMYPPQGIVEPTFRYYQQKVKTVRDAFYADLFLQETEAPDMTATEVLERKNERLSRISPISAQVEGELFKPLVERSFSLAITKGLMAEMPDEFRGVEFEVSYTSRLSSMLMRNEMQSSLQAFMEAASVAEGATNMPVLTEIIDIDRFIQEIFDSNNVDPDMTRTMEAIQKIRQEKAEAEQAMREQEIRANSMKPVDPSKAVEEGSPLKELQDQGGLPV